MRELTGPRVLAITVSAFGVIVAANITLAYKAVSTFPGLEVRSSFVASQDFDQARQAQMALGWVLAPSYDAGRQQLALRITDAAGQPVVLADLKVLVGRATAARDDQFPVFVNAGGAYVAPAQLRPGKWMLQIEAQALDGTMFRQRHDLVVRG